MTSINYNEFQAGQGVSAPALNENFTLTNSAIENLEMALNSSIGSLTSETAKKNGSSSENFSVANATETTHAVNLGQIISKLTPIGSVIWAACATAPDGYFVCNGSAVNRIDYSELFAVIGTSFGEGDGSTTFNLPDLIGKVAYGSNVINENSLITANQSQDHSHRVNNIMEGPSSRNTTGVTSNHTHSIPACGLLPCIKY